MVLGHGGGKVFFICCDQISPLETRTGYTFSSSLMSSDLFVGRKPINFSCERTVDHCFFCYSQGFPFSSSTTTNTFYGLVILSSMFSSTCLALIYTPTSLPSSAHPHICANQLLFSSTVSISTSSSCCYFKT